MTATPHNSRRRHLVACAALSALLLMPAAASARGEGVYARELALARQSLFLGNVEEAIRIYGRILDQSPEEESAFWGLVEVYASAAMDREDLVPLLTDWLADHPDDLRAQRELGAAHARLGEYDRAHEIWIDSLHQGMPDPSRYSEIGSLELRHRMVEQSVETYLEARRVFEMPGVFAQELVRAYTELGDYEEAMDECITAVEEHSGIVQWAVNRVELMLDEGVERRDIERRADEVLVSDESSSPALSFAGSVYMVLDRPDRAMETFLRADDVSLDEGRRLLEHASIMRDGGFAAEALEIFRSVQERHPNSVVAAKAGVEIGRGLAIDGRLEEALAVLLATGDRYRQFSEGGEALLAAAELELTLLHDPTAAIDAIDEMLEGPRSRGKLLVEEARLLKVNALLALGRFEDAHVSAEGLLSGRLHEQVEESASYARGFSSFLAHERRRALDEFREMIEADTAGKLVNDALRIMLVIAEAEEGLGDGPAGSLADAHALHLRGDEAGAAALLEQLVESNEGSVAATEALLLLGNLASAKGEHERALEVYSRVVDGSPSVTARAEALMRSGDIMLHVLDRPEDAVDSYAAILEDLPKNALSGEARRKIDAVRKGRGVEG